MAVIPSTEIRTRTAAAIRTRTAAGLLSPRSAIDAALELEGELQDAGLVAARRATAREEPLAALQELAALDGRLLHEARRLARAHAEKDAALVLTTRLNRKKLFDAMRVRQRIVGSRTALLHTLDEINRQRAELRDEALHTLEDHAIRTMKRYRELRRKLAAARSKNGEMAKNGDMVQGTRCAKQSMVFQIIRSDQSELLECERKLRSLEDVALSTFRQPSAALCGHGLAALNQSLFATPQLAVTRLQAIAKAAALAAKGEIDSVAIGGAPSSDKAPVRDLATWEVGERRRLAAIRAQGIVAAPRKWADGADAIERARLRKELEATQTFLRARMGELGRGEGAQQHADEARVASDGGSAKQDDAASGSGSSISRLAAGRQASAAARAPVVEAAGAMAPAPEETTSAPMETTWPSPRQAVGAAAYEQADAGSSAEAVAEAMGPLLSQLDRSMALLHGTLPDGAASKLGATQQLLARPPLAHRQPPAPPSQHRSSALARELRQLHHDAFRHAHTAAGQQQKAPPPQRRRAARSRSSELTISALPPTPLIPIPLGRAHHDTRGQPGAGGMARPHSSSCLAPPRSRQRLSRPPSAASAAASAARRAAYAYAPTACLAWAPAAAPPVGAAATALSEAALVAALAPPHVGDARHRAAPTPDAAARPQPASTGSHNNPPPPRRVQLAARGPWPA